MKKKLYISTFLLAAIFFAGIPQQRAAAQQQPADNYQNGSDNSGNGNTYDNGYNNGNDQYNNQNNGNDQYSNGDEQNNDQYDNQDNGDDNEGSYNGGGPGVNLDVFVNTLSPYGRWMNYSSYGRVWICNEPGFSPYYTNGHWAYSDLGWTWVSGYDWGWAPFHYGRWLYDNYYGWIWVPGYQWAPAWVAWRNGGDYYGWAPLCPGLQIGVNFGIGFDSYLPANRWFFVEHRYISYPYIGRYCVNRSRNYNIYNNTTYISNTGYYRNSRYVAGPRRNEVEGYTGRNITPLRVTNASGPGVNRYVNRTTIQMYRPVERRNSTPQQGETRFIDRSFQNSRPTNGNNTSRTQVIPYNNNPGNGQGNNNEGRQNNQRTYTPPQNNGNGNSQLFRRQNQQRNNQNYTPPVQRQQNTNIQRNNWQQPQYTPRQQPQQSHGDNHGGGGGRHRPG